MTADLKPYPKYKESGLAWIGQIPARWTSQRLRQVCQMLVSNIDKHTYHNEMPVRLCNYVDVYKNERIHGALRFMKATASADEIRSFRLRAYP